MTVKRGMWRYIQWVDQAADWETDSLTLTLEQNHMMTLP